MIESLRTRWIIIILVTVAGIIWTVPNFVNTDKMWWPTKAKMVLGLDIQGGSHLVLGVDVDSAVKKESQRMAQMFRDELPKEQVAVTSVEVTDELRGAMTINVASTADVEKVTAYLERIFGGQTFNIDEAAGNAVRIEFGELHLRDFKSKLVEQAIAVIRNRIDEFGVAEPSITAQGTDRILVQLPGIKDASNAKDLINRTARLDFMMVYRGEEANPAKLEELIKEAETANNIKFGELRYSQYVDKINEALKGKLPANTLIYFEKPESAETLAVGRIPYLLKTDDVVTGDRLTNAQVSMDQYGKPVVHFAFDPVGTREFGALTTKHVNENMAIVLDKVVKSAPNINEPITGGSGQITLGGGRDMNASLNEAKLIATALRAGALPAALEQLEERTVGPSLGADAIRQGQIGTMIAALAVFVFMLLYYRTFGIVANLSLILNVMLTVAGLSALGATLTLPGIAGLALTLGMGVDSNVIIYERVKEEMSKGASVTAAIREGFDRAFSSILDGHVTSILVCFVLIYFGTGPVRGFAVTLVTGLFINLFTAVFFTRAMFDLMTNKLKIKPSVGWGAQHV
ncbi:MAG TPA: protein translocase subunit SecD [Bdellovibrionales bacterium]|nr:protein translocase subunit SecD [Bdellovibrionales bacterium]